MTSTQAQSPRLGQRVAAETTFVQIFDVDPDTDIPDLVEAAWPGMLIFLRQGDGTGVLMIYNGEAGAWEEVAGGVGGRLTYVSPDEPTGTFTVGDVWYDSDDNYKQYVWDGDSWALVSAVGGITTFYQGSGTDGIPTATAVGDLWFNTDDAMHPYRWDGAMWVDIKDPGLEPAMDQGVVNTEAINLINDSLLSMSTSLANLTLTAGSSQNSADTADGRVSMSDYIPGEDDLTYPAQQIDPVTGEPVTVMIPRQNGSIWFTRTRPRINLCTNPSFEWWDALTQTWQPTDVGWSYTNVTAYPHDHHTVPAGIWTLHVENGTTSGDHVVKWGQSNRAPCAEGDWITASIYAELLTGTVNGVVLELLWYDAAGINIGTATSTPYNLIAGAFDPALFGTIAEPRYWVSAQAPTGAVSFYVREVAPAGSENAEWHTGALLVEKEDDLGQYFDGDSFDGLWDGVPANSTSHLVGDKIRYIYELRDGKWIQKFITEDALYLIDVKKLIGELDAEVSIRDNTITPDKMRVTLVLASENLTAGNLVQVWNNAGVSSVRKASASSLFAAHGFVLDNVASGALAKVYHVGYNHLVTNLVPGVQFLSTTAGTATNRAPSAVGTIVQRIGFAASPTVLCFEPQTPVRIT